MAEAYYYTLYATGNLGLDGASFASSSPALVVEDEMYIDGSPIPYFVRKFDFRPNEDIATEDTGFGVVRIAWENLENSGNLSFQLDDVPAEQLDAELSRLLTVKPYRWLSFRGRRYRTSGFDVTYAPHRDTAHYTLDVTCTAYRPHKALPPVPGTEIFPMLDLRRQGGRSVYDKILDVGGTLDWMFVIHTSGLFAFNTQTRENYDFETTVETGGVVSKSETMYYVAYGQDGRTVLQEFDPARGFRNTQTLNVPFDYATHRLRGDTLIVASGAGLQQLSFFQSNVHSIDDAPANLRVNRADPNTFLYAGTTAFPDTFSNCPAEILGVAMSGKSRAIVVKADGVYLYEASITETGYTLGSQLRKLDDATNIKRFGLLGSPGAPEGYWVVNEEEEVLEAYMPEGAEAAPTVALLHNAEGMLTQAASAHIELEDGAVQPMATTDDPYSVYVIPTLNMDLWTFSGIESEEPVTATSGPGVGIAQTATVDISAVGEVTSARFILDAEMPAGTSITVEASVDGGAWTELSYEEQGSSVASQAATRYEGDIPGLAGATTLSFRFTLQADDVSVAVPRLYSAGWLLSSLVEYGEVVGGVIQVPITYRSAFIRSAYAENEVSWDNLRGIHFDGYAYYAYTDLHVFQTFPLL